MLTHQVLQKTARDICRITDATCSIWSAEGKNIVTAGKEMPTPLELIQEFILQKEECEKIEKEVALFVVEDDEIPIYIIALQKKKMSKEAFSITGQMAVSQLENLIYAYKEKMDRNHFFQNLILDNLLLVDIYNQARKLNISQEDRRVVFMIEPKSENDSIVIETMKGLYATGSKDYVTAVDERNVVLIKKLETTEEYKELQNTAQSIADTLNAEAMVSVRVSYGTIVNELSGVSKSYKEASMALEVGRIFYSERSILAYKELGIGRLIHQLPISLCDMFLEEVFSGNALEQFEEETLSTVNKFFENSLNISETARKLYVHRNTLVYRLEKIQKTTGLDVRVFEDALTFKIALMVASHKKFFEEKE